MDELFDIVNESGDVIGTAPRSQCHGNPKLVHRSVHVVVKSGTGDILLQKRVMTKDVQPGKWDTAVGGHLGHGEDYLTAAMREMREELGVCPIEPLTWLFDYQIRNDFESENVRVFQTVHNGPFVPQPSEVERVQFHSCDDLKHRLLQDDARDFTPVLRGELRILLCLPPETGLPIKAMTTPPPETSKTGKGTK